MGKNDFKTLALALVAFVGAFSVAPIFATDARIERFCSGGNCCNGGICVGGASCDCCAGCNCCGGGSCATNKIVALTYPEPYGGFERVPDRITIQVGPPSPVPGWRPWRPWGPWRPGPRPVRPRPEPRPVHPAI